MTPADEMVPVDKMVTEPLRVPGRSSSSGFWREFAGALAAGVVLLAAVVLVLQAIAWARGMPGLGTWVLLGHLAAAVLAVAAQRVVDRRTGKPAMWAGLGTGAVALAALLLFWWS